jgi:UDP-glucose 4-epimerase
VTESLSWVVGRGGLLGRHVESALLAADTRAEAFRPSGPIPWHDSQEAGIRLELEAARFLEGAARSQAPWRLLWCAGTSGIATTPEVLSLETSLLSRLLDAVARRVSDDPGLASAGTLFFASSAGGVYAGGVPPFDELSPEHPLAPYGREKLLQEELVARLAATRGVDVLVGRLSNLYGPGQTLSKPQGLVAHVGRAALLREPVSIWVPLDTIRDYLFAADAGRMAVAAIERREDARRRGRDHGGVGPGGVATGAAAPAPGRARLQRGRHPAATGPVVPVTRLARPSRAAHAAHARRCGLAARPAGSDAGRRPRMTRPPQDARRHNRRSPITNPAA